MFVFNTLSREKEEFFPLEKGIVKMYSCGPTVYDFPHIGNYRAFLFADLLKRYLKFKGLKVTHVMNLTDVDDKTIAGAQKANVPLAELTEKYAQIFFTELKLLNLQPADFYPRATLHVDEMVELIKQLLKDGFAYNGDDGGVYFSIKKFKTYGKLSHLKLGELKKGASGRLALQEYTREQASDFVLWKAWKEGDGDVFWEAEFGRGRPGWHIECSAMSMKYLGESFDIHTGGVDLMFPHHENEIAQSEAATRKKFVNYWMHNEHLLVNGTKMSKSLGNFYTLHQLLEKGVDAKGFRYLMISSHYRQQFNFTFESLDGAEKTVKKLQNFVFELRSVSKNGELHSEVEKIISNARKTFLDGMDDDLNTPLAFPAIFELQTQIYKLMQNASFGFSKKDAAEVLSQLQEFDSVIGVLDFELQEDVPEEVKALVAEREAAKNRKDFKAADLLREKVKKLGFAIEDSKDGVKVKKSS